MLKKLLLPLVLISSTTMATDDSGHFEPKNSNQTGDYVIKRNSGWDALSIRNYGTSAGDNFSSIDVLSYPLDSDDTILNSITDSAIIAKRQDTSGNTELVGLFSNGYPNSSQIHGIEIQAFGDDAKIRDFVFLTKDNTPNGDSSYKHYITHKVSNPNNRHIVNHIPSENRIVLQMNNHGFQENDAICVVGNSYYKTNASSTTTNNHKYIGIARKIIDANKFEITLSGSTVPKIIGQSGDTIYLDTTWGKLSTQKPTVPNLVLQVGININNHLMYLSNR
jgi:hypothetical protein